MSGLLLPRSCSELGEENEAHPCEKALADYESAAAYVLLGAPGAGKTVAFRQAQQREGAFYVTARDFATFDDRPEWHGRTLFIDALDEMRSGAVDGRTPLDAIRNKLNNLGRPHFRLSCREADWLGRSDRQHLQAVSKDREVRVLRLNPLSGSQVRKLLAQRADVACADGFIASAEARGLSSLLGNPLTLNLLAQAVAHGGSWPQTRRETFDMACRQLLCERNVEHRAGGGASASPVELLNAAGRLCAVLLLSGHHRFAIGDAEPGCIALHDIAKRIETALAVVRTRLFACPSGCAMPTHQHIAEYLAGRYLARLVGEGLPVRRVTALATGHDGGVASSLRGLCAWLASHSPAARGDCIERDPIGVVLYGDVRLFATSEKQLLIQALEAHAEQDPHHLLPWHELDVRWGDLATPDVEPIFRQVLNDTEGGDAKQAVAQAVLKAMRRGASIPALRSLLMDVVRNDRCWPAVRSLALDAYLKQHDDNDSASVLRQLLDDIDAGAIRDPADGLRGACLTHLYPKWMTPTEVCAYLRPSNKPSIHSLGQWFRTHTAVDASTATQRATFKHDELQPNPQRRWQDHLHQHEAEMRANKCPPALLDDIAQACFSLFESGENPTARLQAWLGDESLVQLALAAIRDTPARDDLPSAVEIIALASAEERHYLGRPFLAALEELWPLTIGKPPLDDDGIRLAVTLHLHHQPRPPPCWYKSVLREQPGLVADALIDSCKAAFRQGRTDLVAAIDFTDDAAQGMAKRAVAPLLRAFPHRCRLDQLPALRRLLTAAQRSCPNDELTELVRRKLTLGSMTTPQRLHWLCLGLTLAPQACLPQVQKLLCDTPGGRHVNTVVALLDDGVLQPQRLDVAALALLVQAIAMHCTPSRHQGHIPDSTSMRAADAVRRLVAGLASRTTPDATNALAQLSASEQLHHWKAHLHHEARRQADARRDAEFRHASANAVASTLDGLQPANAADLAALTVDHLEQLADRIRNGNTSDWRQYWNTPSQGEWESKTENLCRDNLLSDLRFPLQQVGVQAEPEGVYAADRRADIRVSREAFNVPVEIKKSTSKDLWQAIQSQLIERYTVDPDANGHGIYLVFWFGAHACQRPPSGRKPRTAAELATRLGKALTPDQAQKVSVVVIDVSRRK